MKLTQAELKGRIEQWAGLQARMKKLADAKNAELDPFLTRYQEDTAPIVERYDAKIGKLHTEAKAIEAEVLGWLNGVGKPIALDGGPAAAVNEVIVGKRVISVQQFFDRVKERSAAFWDCLSVGVAKAEKLIGTKAVDEISTKETKLVPSLRLK